MTGALILALLSAAPPAKSELERIVRDRFEAVGRTAPPVDPALSAAADELARRALTHGVDDASSLLRVTAAISRQGAADSSNVLVALRSPNASLAQQLKTQDLGVEPATHVGVGLAVGAEVSSVFLVLAHRRIALEPFRRTHARPVVDQRLCGVLAEGLDSAELFVTRPEGAVDRLAMPANGATRCASIDFPAPGRHTVEVLGRGPRGPEVAALFFVDVGTVVATEDDALAEPKSVASARAMLLLRINALRLQGGLAAVQHDAALEAIAQAWAQRLADEGFFSHVAPDGSVLTDRLASAGYVSAVAGENLGLSSGPLAAHFGIEHSPGHRNNLLDPRHRKLGLGLATRPDGLQVLVELLAAPPDETEEKDPLGSVYASIAAERKRKKLPALIPNPALEGLAQVHARQALEKDLPKGALPGEKPLSERAFALMDELNGVAVDVMVLDAPRLGAESKNLASPGNRMVGVGLVKGDSPRFGRGRYWIVVIYGAPRE